MLEDLKRRARELKRETYVLYLAYRDPRTPWHARFFGALVVAYAFSPIDLILIPLGVYLALKMIPPDVLEVCRQQAELVMAQGTPTNNKAAAIAIVAIWLLLAVAIALILYRHMWQ